MMKDALKLVRSQQQGGDHHQDIENGHGSGGRRNSSSSSSHQPNNNNNNGSIVVTTTIDTTNNDNDIEQKKKQRILMYVLCSFIWNAIFYLSPMIILLYSNDDNIHSNSSEEQPSWMVDETDKYHELQSNIISLRDKIKYYWDYENKFYWIIVWIFNTTIAIVVWIFIIITTLIKKRIDMILRESPTLRYGSYFTLFVNIILLCTSIFVFYL